MQYRLALAVEWDYADGTIGQHREAARLVRAVSRKHALDKGLRYLESLPCYRDRVGTCRVETSATIVEVVSR